MRWRRASGGVAMVALVATTLGLGSASAGVQGGGAQLRVIASGLDNPRDLAFGPGGALYVAEAGHGGGHCSPAGPDQICVGRTSKISRVLIRQGGVRRVVTRADFNGRCGWFGCDRG